MYHPSRGGVRGGRDQFSWDDVKVDKHRENYLGHNLKAPVERWQKVSCSFPPMCLPSMLTPPMATLGIRDATKKSLVQCNVGNRSPVFLCTLLPNIIESCHLYLKFEEAYDVVFCVIDPRSFYLTGYFVQRNPQSNTHSDMYPFQPFSLVISLSAPIGIIVLTLQFHPVDNVKAQNYPAILVTAGLNGTVVHGSIRNFFDRNNG
ncbi:uncharacterized protein [Henckelia pumila]|uniref:uncharacterized protein isoform X3 n=1 Tax=Henckelia pumila TaxID=405737 RepID=UPI003C6E5FC3